MAPPSIHCSYLYEDGHATSHSNNNDINHDDEIGNGVLSALIEKEFLHKLHSDYLKNLSDSNNGNARARDKAVSWILKVQKYHCFAAETALLAVNYLDRFLSCTEISDRQKREWVMQLVSVACLSLAAKMEETHVPLLVDLQVEGAEHVFDAGTIQRMELILLGALKWRMITVTPLSYIHHGTRILGLQHYRHCRKNFILRCNEVALCAVKDPRTLGFRPSVVAAATMMFAMRETRGLENGGCESRLVSGLKVDKVAVGKCYHFLLESLGKTLTCKRRACNSCSYSLVHGSPHGVLNANFSCTSDNSTVNCAFTGPSFETSGAKKRKIEDLSSTHGSAEKAY